MTDSKDTRGLGFKGLHASPKFWVVLAACLGITASITSFTIIYRLQQGETKAIFYRAAEDTVSSLEQGLDTYMIVLQSLAAFHDASEEVTRQAFGRFDNRFLIQYPGVQALEWIPRVPITLGQETESQRGFLVFVPVYRKGAVSDSIETRRANLVGFFLGVFLVGDFGHHYAVLRCLPKIRCGPLVRTMTPSKEPLRCLRPRRIRRQADRCGITQSG